MVFHRAEQAHPRSRNAATLAAVPRCQFYTKWRLPNVTGKVGKKQICLPGGWLKVSAKKQLRLPFAVIRNRQELPSKSTVGLLLQLANAFNELEALARLWIIAPNVGGTPRADPPSGVAMINVLSSTSAAKRRERRKGRTDWTKATASAPAGESTPLPSSTPQNAGGSRKRTKSYLRRQVRRAREKQTHVESRSELPPNPLAAEVERLNRELSIALRRLDQIRDQPTPSSVVAGIVTEAQARAVQACTSSLNLLESGLYHTTSAGVSTKLTKGHQLGKVEFIPPTSRGGRPGQYVKVTLAFICETVEDAVRQSLSPR